MLTLMVVGNRMVRDNRMVLVNRMTKMHAAVCT